MAHSLVNCRAIHAGCSSIAIEAVRADIRQIAELFGTIFRLIAARCKENYLAVNCVGIK
jgi:hypothetical protein